MKELINQVLQTLKKDFGSSIFKNEKLFRSALKDVQIKTDGKKIRNLLKTTICDMQVYSRIESATDDFVINNLVEEMSSDYMIDKGASRAVVECIAKLLKVYGKENAQGSFDDEFGRISRITLKIYWLLDVSGSMSGDKIATVNRAIKACIDSLKDAADDNHEAQMYVRAMKFSIGAHWHTGETKIEDFRWHDLNADVGNRRDTGAALKLMAQELTIEKMARRNLPPVIILISDGEATDDYEGGIKELLSQKWGKKAVRIAIAIGSDTNTSELLTFCSNKRGERLLFAADKASDLIRYIEWDHDVSASASSTQMSTKIVDSLPALYDEDWW